MNYTEKMVCPNGCNARFIATAHVTQDWYVDEHGNYLDTAQECVETTHSPDFHDVWRCENAMPTPRLCESRMLPLLSAGST